MRLPNEFAGWSQIPKKIIETPNLPINPKKFSKKMCFVPQKWKTRSKNLYGSYPTEFAARTKILKKLSLHQINQLERKFSQNKYD
jgi:hypothetical protein